MSIQRLGTNRDFEPVFIITCDEIGCLEEQRFTHSHGADNGRLTEPKAPRKWTTYFEHGVKRFRGPDCRARLLRKKKKESHVTQAHRAPPRTAKRR